MSDPSTSAQAATIEWRVVNYQGHVVAPPSEQRPPDQAAWDARFPDEAPHRVESREVGGWK